MSECACSRYLGISAKPGECAVSECICCAGPVCPDCGLVALRICPLMCFKCIPQDIIYTSSPDIGPNAAACYIAYKRSLKTKSARK